MYGTETVLQYCGVCLKTVLPSRSSTHGTRSILKQMLPMRSPVGCLAFFRQLQNVWSQTQCDLNGEQQRNAITAMISIETLRQACRLNEIRSIALKSSRNVNILKNIRKKTQIYTMICHLFFFQYAFLDNHALSSRCKNSFQKINTRSVYSTFEVLKTLVRRICRIKSKPSYRFGFIQKRNLTR